MPGPAGAAAHPRAPAALRGITRLPRLPWGALHALGPITEGRAGAEARPRGCHAARLCPLPGFSTVGGQLPAQTHQNALKCTIPQRTGRVTPPFGSLGSGTCSSLRHLTRRPAGENKTFLPRPRLQSHPLHSHHISARVQAPTTPPGRLPSLLFSHPASPAPPARFNSVQTLPQVCFSAGTQHICGPRHGTLVPSALPSQPALQTGVPAGRCHPHTLTAA